MKEDISKKISFDFNELDAKEIREIIGQMYVKSYNVGHDQLIRSLLLLSKGSVEKFRSYFPISDPRDIIIEANNNYGCTGNYFNKPLNDDLHISTS